MVELLFTVGIHLTITPLAIFYPALRSINSSSIDLQPLTHLNQTIFHDNRYTPIRRGSNIEKKVAAARDNITQHENQQLRAVIIIKRLLAVITERFTYPAILFP